MARLAALGLTFLCSFRLLVLMMVQGGLLPVVLLAVTALAQRCTRAVPVHRQPAKKLKILKRIPASCSNWDKTWSWLTGKDCNTKYRLETVEVPPDEVRQYKLQHYCCDGADKCEEAENRHSTGFDSTDTKFLAVVLGSTAACIVIVIIIFAITFYTKKSRCVLCDHSSHAYTSAGECSDGEDSRDDSPVEDKVYPGEGRTRHESSRSGRERGPFWDSDTEQPEVKGAGEAVYAEIGDPADAHLPRYADIFREGREDGTRASEARRAGKTKRSKRDNSNNSNSDPFTNASAPPMYTEVSKTKKPVVQDAGNGNRDRGKCTDAYVNAPSAIRAPPTLKAASEPACVRDDAEIRVVQPAVHTSRRVSDGTSRPHGRQESRSHHNAPVKEESRNQNDPKYYNVQEKKKKKRKPSNGSGSTTVAGGKQQKASTSIRSEHSNAGKGNFTAASAKARADARRGKSGGTTTIAMEMTLSKSSSASETMGKSSSECSETSLSRLQKRRSAPPGSTVYENQNQTYSPLQQQTPPQPPQSAAPPRPSTISNSLHSPDAIINMKNANNTCGVIYEAQAPPSNTEKEKKIKQARKSSNSSSPAKPSKSSNPSSDATENLQTAASSPHNYENANLVTLDNSGAENSQNGKAKLEKNHSTSNNHSTGSGSVHHSDNQTARPIIQTSLTSTSSPGKEAKQASEAAVLNLGPSAASPCAPFSLLNSESAGSASASQESSPLPSPLHGESSNGNSGPANTYDKLHFEEFTKSLSGKSPSPNTHVYQSLESANPCIPDSIFPCDKNAETLDVNNKLESERFDGPSRGESRAQFSDEEKDRGSPPPPSLPPRCPIAPNKRAVDGLSV